MSTTNWNNLTVPPGGKIQCKKSFAAQTPQNFLVI
jgi:hypothetical protein